MLAACSASAPSAPISELKGALAAPPVTLSAPCVSPSDLPDGPLSAGAVERAWAQDRSELMHCGVKHEKTVEFYKVLLKGLAGE